MRHLWKKAWAAGMACSLAVAAAGCYGYGSYNSFGSSANRVKTTASPETVEVLDLLDLQDDDGTFQYSKLPWGSSYKDLEALIETPVGTTTAFDDGETLGDINYSYQVLDYLTVGLQPLYDPDGGLSCITFYFETTYTSQQLDQIYDEIQEAAREAFGKEDKEESSDQSSGNLTYQTTTSFWYHEVSEQQMTSFQLGKLDSGNGTAAVVIGVNIYDPALAQTGSEEESPASGTKETSKEAPSPEELSAEESTEE